MNLYKQYLKTEHWKQFRKKIYQKRQVCQNCGSRRQLNIHHKNYKNLGKEINEDIIVLCQGCHNNFHKKKKWQKKLKRGGEMNFVGASEKVLEKAFYKMQSNEKRQCARCGKMHPIFYKKIKGGKIQLIIICPNSKPRSRAIPFEANLKIPFIKSLSIQKNKE